MDDFYTKLKNSSIPLIMGIVNVTPDSFSDGGKYLDANSALNHVLNLIDFGADIIDIGGESSRPGADQISSEEELKRVIPVLENIRKNNNDVFLSIDTTKSEVAKEAINCGINLINDISAGSFDPKILDIVKKNKIPYVLMHMKGNPKNMQNKPFYENTIYEIFDFFQNKISELKLFGIEKIIIDPGIGFGKRVEDNFRILNNLEKLLKFNFPILVGLSKKSFLGKSLNLEVSDRENSTIISETIAVMRGAKIIRTHNVKNAVELKKIYKNLIESNN
ncbi:MAG: dihydropteroate synthase [Ignavibacteriae bacterium]|nr:dihydropteroate synthase [Ignavibacteriota bacterium]